MRSFCVVGLLLALCPFFNHGLTSIRVPLKKRSSELKSTLLSSSVTVSNSSTIFFATMALGTPEQSFTFALDTTSNVVWIPGTSCTSCGNGALFNSTNSTTFISTSVEETYTFNAFGSVNYIIGSDILTVNGLNCTDQTIGVASLVTTSLDGIDGFAGLGPGDISFVANILSQNNLSSVFSLYISPTSSGAEAGEIILGSSTSDDYSIGDLVSASSQSKDGQWIIEIQNITVGDNNAIVNESSTAQIAILASPYITGPKTIIESIYTAIQTNSTGFVNNSVDLPSVTFAIGGSNFSLTSDEYLLSCDNGNCSTKFVVSESANQLILGTVFVSKYYWVFNVTSSEIQIASINGCYNLQPSLFILTALAWAWLYLDKNRST